MVWIDICGLEEIPRMGARVLDTTQGNVALFRTALDEVYALLDRCPHKGGPLSQGIVFENRVACPMHDWVIDLEKGCATGPDEGCARTFPVRISDTRVFISLDEGIRPVSISGVSGA